MPWDYSRSRDRIVKHLEDLTSIEVSKLAREADLESLLSERQCREVFGAHVYITVSTFARLASDNAETENYRRLIQALHVYQREMNRIVEHRDGVDGLSVHFQGQKIHALLYRPIDDARVLASRAVVLQLIVRDFVKNVFNPAFPHFDNFVVSGGTDIGSVIGTKNGSKGDRELLFLGNAANHAAKVIAGNGLLRLTSRIHAELPKRLKEICAQAGDDVFRLESLSSRELDALLSDLTRESSSLSVDWNRNASERRIEEDKRNTPLKDIEYSGATELVDIDTLSVRNNKRVSAASLFADVSGFTRYIEAAASNKEKQIAIRVFHAIRREMSLVIRDDVPGRRVQYQGDRVQGIYHIPPEDPAAAVEDAVTAGAAIQSSLGVLQELVAEAEALSMAVGVDYGGTLVSKLGTRGQRDRICVGEPVDGAASCEEAATGGEIALSQAAFALLPEAIRDVFGFDPDRQIYIAAGVSADRLARAWRASEAVAGAPRYISTSRAGAKVFVTAEANAREIPDDRPHVTTVLD
jgi:class 3 adenylate cyclase